MCGIAGSYLSNETAPIEMMVAGLNHRGPDGHGLVKLPFGVLGHTRLAIIDPAGGQQPMQNGGDWITFNGEIYNYKRLHGENLRAKPLETGSDTEVLLHLYCQEGPRSTALLDGMFAFAVVKNGDLFLARDPLGIKPLYMGWDNHAFYFASEIKILQKTCTSISEFPAGHWFHSRLGWKKYYDLPAEIQEFRGVKKSAQTAYRRILAEAVAKRLVADVPVGISLSGGLDSSIIAYLAAQAHPRIETFAVGMADGSDLAAARIVAGYLGTVHHELIYSEQEMLDALPEVIRHLESFDPALVRSAIPNYFLAKFASRRVKVILTGEGADELFAGYDYMRSFVSPAALNDELALVTGALHNTNLQRADRMSMAFGLEARVPFLDRKSVAFALGIPASWKFHAIQLPKAFLRGTFKTVLPQVIVDRPKLKFSKGAGSSDILEIYANRTITDAEFLKEQGRIQNDWKFELKTKEGLLYYKILKQSLADPWIFRLMGCSRSL